MTLIKKRAFLLCKIGALFLFLIGVLAALHSIKGTDDPLTAAERSWANAHPVIRLAPDPHFQPIEYFDEKGAYRGVTKDYLALLEKKLGIHFEIVRLGNWDEIIKKAKSREIDVYVASKTPQRAEYMLFTKPYLEFPLVILARETKEKVRTRLTLDDLFGMRVSVVSNYAPHDLIKSSHPGLHLDPVPDVKTGLRKVSFGLTDVFVECLATATYYMEKEGISNLRIAGESGYFYRLGFCSRKDWPELNRILEKGVASVSADEEKAIFSRLIPFETRSLLFDRQFQRRLGVAVTAIVVILAWVLAWNRVLARQVTVRTSELERELAERKRAEGELLQAREELERKVAERTLELQNANGLLEREVAVRRRTESVNTARLRLLHFAGTHSLDELLEATIDEAEALTGSLIGFYHVLDPNEDMLSLQNWSTRTKAEFCKAPEKGSHYRLSAAGVWVDCVRERRPVIHNDYGSLPHRRGLPPEHAPVVREVVVPVLRGDEVVAVLGVGNKALDYTSEDVEVISVLADLAWEITERKRMEEELLTSQFSIDSASIGIYRTDENGVIFDVNDHACSSLGYSKKELLELSVFDIDPEATPERMRELKKVLDACGFVTHETTHRRKNGATFPVEITVNVLEFRGKKFAVSFVKDITEQTQALEELRLTQFYVDEASIGIHRISNEGKILATNKTFCRNLGYTAEELCAMTIFDIAPTLDLDGFRENRRLTVQAGSLTIESVHRRKDGSIFPVEVTINYLHYQGKEVTVSFAKDITERKRAEEALRESQARLKMAMDLAALVQWEFDVATGMFTFDDQFFALYGTTVEREGGMLMSAAEYARKFVPMEESTMVAGGIAEVLERHSNRLEHRIIRGDGEERVIVVRGEAIRDQEGRIVKMRGANQDITERKRMEEELRESREKYQAIVDSFDGLIYVASDDLRIQFMNRKLLERTGYDAIGAPCYQVMHDRDTVCPWCLNHRVFAGETVHWDMYSPKDGCWYEVLNVPIRHADGSLSKHSMMIDITDRKAAEDELKRQTALLQNLNETLEKRVGEEVAKNREKDTMLIQQNRQAALGEMLDHIAHQWKQPLNSIALLVSVIGETPHDDEAAAGEVKEMVTRIQAILHHMAQTLDVFRGFYRPDKEKKSFRLKESIDQALAFISPAYRFHFIRVEVDVDPGLMAYGYAKEYTQVLLNILGNARDVFGSRKTRNPKVMVKAYAEDTRTVVTIADNAGGIPEAIMDLIFDFYFTTNESGEGTGIGLYMSKNIIEKNMGGALSAENTEEGALFKIEVPAA